MIMMDSLPLSSQNPIIDINVGVKCFDDNKLRTWNTLSDEAEYSRGFLLNKIPSEISSTIDKELDNIINSSDRVKVNHLLAGQIEKEYLYEPSLPVLKYIQSLVEQYENYSHGYLAHHVGKKFPDGTPLKLTTTPFWVNLQKKYEYNPIHDHSGILSFVIWHKVPFLYKDEVEQDPTGKYRSIPNPRLPVSVNGLFGFIYSSSKGRIKSEYLPIDKNWEGYIAVFPADLFHLVNPFYTSDDYRVSISGNILIDYKN